MEKGYKGEGLLNEKERREGVWAKSPSSPTSRQTGQRRGKAPAPALGPAAWDFERGQGAGQKHEGSEGILFLCSPGAGAARRDGATAASGAGSYGRIGGAGCREGGGAVVDEFVVLEGCARAYL